MRIFLQLWRSEIFDLLGQKMSSLTEILDELTYNINGAIFEVNRELGVGFLEKVYENALLLELRKRGLKAESQVPVKVKFKGTEVGEYYADIVVENQVIVELKSVDSLQKIHEAQLLNYLKATGYKVGLLVNFTHPKAEIKRPLSCDLQLSSLPYRPTQTVRDRIIRGNIAVCFFCVSNVKKGMSVPRGSGER